MVLVIQLTAALRAGGRGSFQIFHNLCFYISQQSQVDQYIDLTMSFFFFAASFATEVINDVNSRVAL